MKTNMLSKELTIPYEIEIHYKRPLFKTMTLIENSEDAQRVIRSFINKQKIDLKECFWVLLLSHANRLLGFSEVSTGTTRGVMVNTKEIFQLLLKSNASAFIVCHNHPSGKLVVSESDKKHTRKLKTLAQLIEVSLLDHIIITSEDYLSFSNEGEL